MHQICLPFLPEPLKINVAFHGSCLAEFFACGPLETGNFDLGASGFGYPKVDENKHFG